MPISVIHRDEARKAGLRRFFTGVPCIHGHISERSVSGLGCCACNVLSKRKMRVARRGEINARQREQRAKDPDRFREYQRAWCQRNIEKRKAYKRKSLAKPSVKDRAKETTKIWRERNRDRFRRTLRQGQRNRKARLKGATGWHSEADIHNIYKLQRGRCAYCRVKITDNYEVDHIIPLSRGGSNWPANLQLTCGNFSNRCNGRKSSKDPIDFARELGMLV